MLLNKIKKLCLAGRREKLKVNYWQWAAIFGFFTFLVFSWIFGAKDNSLNLENFVLPEDGVVLPVSLGDIGVKMADAGVIDPEKLGPAYQGLLSQGSKDNLEITPENSGIILNILWALGLGNKNDILEKGPMMDAGYGGPGNFASTGGWTLAKGDAMDHYSSHSFIVLTKEQQALVERVSKNIYRPCCNNPTYFPDCNHGMAMLGLLELMASQGVSEEEMYRVALRVNSYWFPDTYLAIAQYLETKSISFEKANPKEILGYNFSSAWGYRQILNQITPLERKSNSGCGA
ncbi:MAG: hypothetical protein HYW70_03495 [Candidatus Nealsonbacteria bacterium]|nr:hypothetical protein [Candidatus Nealsonbacteria bacterium]